MHISSRLLLRNDICIICIHKLNFYDIVDNDIFCKFFKKLYLLFMFRKNNQYENFKLNPIFDLFPDKERQTYPSIRTLFSLVSSLQMLKDPFTINCFSSWLIN